VSPSTWSISRGGGLALREALTIIWETLGDDEEEDRGETVASQAIVRSSTGALITTVCGFSLFFLGSLTLFGGMGENRV
jgi:hypothetical protein